MHELNKMNIINKIQETNEYNRIMDLVEEF